MLVPKKEGKTIGIEEGKYGDSRGQFHSDFPDELTGIIHPDEFQQSIANINRARRSTVWEKKLSYSLRLYFVIGLILFNGGLATIVTFIPALWIPILSVGTVMFLSFCCIGVPVLTRMDRSREARLQNAVDEESMKYSTKLPVPTVWRLNKVVTTSYDDDAPTTIVTYSLLIDIGRRADLEIRSDALNSNSTPSEPMSTIGQQYPILHLSQPNPSAISFSNIRFQSEV